MAPVRHLRKGGFLNTTPEKGANPGRPGIVSASGRVVGRASSRAVFGPS